MIALCTAMGKPFLEYWALVTGWSACSRVRDRDQPALFINQMQLGSRQVFPPQGQAVSKERGMGRKEVPKRGCYNLLGEGSFWRKEPSERQLKEQGRTLHGLGAGGVKHAKGCPERGLYLHLCVCLVRIWREY